MTIATEIPIQQQLLSFGDFIVRYGDSNRYELIDGEVFDLEPTGYHEEVSAFTTRGLREGWELRVFRPKGKTDKCRIYSPSILWYD
jgi:hypothetical protein